MIIMCSHIAFPIGSETPKEYATRLHQSISEVLMLVYERRDLDLCEVQTQALHTLTELQSKLMEASHV